MTRDLFGRSLAAVTAAVISIGAIGCTAMPRGPVHPPRDEAAFWGDHDVESEAATARFELMVGARALAEDNAWSPLDEQTEIGTSVQVPLLGSRSREGLDLADHIDWDFGLRYAFDDGSVAGAAPGDPRRHLDSDIWDGTIGLLASVGSETNWLRPYFGGGAAIVFANVDYVEGTGVASENTTLITGYARGGLRIRFRPGQYFGLDARWLAGGDVDGLDASVEALTISFLFGASF